MKSPFKFLDSFTKDDRDIFFGREREIEELYHRVFESKIMLVYGVSGTGKSSLIHCGLANKFQETDWLPLVIRRGGNILEGMAAAIRAASVTPQPAEISTPSQFRKAVRSLYLDHYKPIFFTFDQFEELFIFAGRDEKQAFIKVIKSIVESEIQCRFIFVIREEYMAHITGFERFIPTIFQNRVRIEKMSHINALEAIKGPCKIANITLEEGFAEAMLEKLSPEGADVELTYLQVFLDKVFRLASSDLPPSLGHRSLGEGVGGELKGASSGPESKGGSFGEKTKVGDFTLALLSHIGNVSDLLGSFLDEQVSLLPDPALAMSVLKAFVSVKGTKRPATFTETIDNIRSLGKEISPDNLESLLQTFVRLRIITDKDDEGRYELRHDTLAEKIFEKFSLAEKELIEIRQFIENAYQSYLKRKILLSTDDLEYISNKDSMLNLKEDLKDFMIESRRLRETKKRTVRRLIAVSFISFLVMMGLLGYYIVRKISNTKADYEAVGMMIPSSDPIEDLESASALWKRSPGALQKEILLRIFNRVIENPGFDTATLALSDKYKLSFQLAPADIEYLSWSTDKIHLFGYGDSVLFIYSIKGKLERTIITDHFPVINMKMSGNNKLIGAVSSDSILTLWDLLGNKLFEKKVRYNSNNTRQIFKFTKENNILALYDGCDAVTLDSVGNIIKVFTRHLGSTNAVDISPDNNFIATASSDSTVNIWYLNTIKGSYDFYNTINQHHDTVWSVSFSTSGIYIVTTSSDGYNRISSINNEKIDDFRFSSRLRFAEFTSSERGITFIAPFFDSNSRNELFYAINWSNPRVDLNNRKGEESYFSLSKFNSIIFSDDEAYYACTEKGKLYLVDNRLAIERSKLEIRFTHTLQDFDGRNPLFTADNRYLLFTKGKEIRSWFIEINAILSESEGLD